MLAFLSGVLAYRSCQITPLTGEAQSLSRIGKTHKGYMYPLNANIRLRRPCFTDIHRSIFHNVWN